MKDLVGSGKAFEVCLLKWQPHPTSLKLRGCCLEAFPHPLQIVVQMTSTRFLRGRAFSLKVYG